LATLACLFAASLTRFQGESAEERKAQKQQEVMTKVFETDEERAQEAKT
jgi:hypothetical protein